jgi:hypothetical protein
LVRSRGADAERVGCSRESEAQLTHFLRVPMSALGGKADEIESSGAFQF